MANRFEQYLTPAAAPRANRFAQFVESQPAPVADTNADRMPEPARLSFAPTPEQESLSARRDKLVTAGMEAYTRTPEGVAKLNAEARAAGIPLGRATQWKRKQLQREASGTDYADSLGILQPQEALSTVRGDAPSKRPVTAGDVGSMSNADRARIIDFADRIQSSPMAQWPAQGDMTSIPGDKEQEGRFAQAIAVLEQLRQKEAPHVPGDQFIRRIGAVADRQIPQRTDKPVTGYDAGATAEAFAGGLISGGGGLLRGIGENLNEAQRYVRGRSTLEEPNTFERVTQGIAETGSNIYDTGQAMSTEAAGGMLERPTTPFMDDPMAYARYYGQQALASSGATLVGVGAGAVNPTLGALAMGGTAFGQGYGDRRAAGQGVGSATRGGAVAAMAETIPEKFSLDVAFGKGVGKAIEESLSRRMLASGVVEPTTEMATEAINAGYEALGENKPVTFDQFKQRVFDAGIIGAISGPAVAGAIHTAQNAGDIRDQIDMARMRTGIKFNNAGLGGQQRTQATTARILSTADPAAAAGADIADQAFRNAGVGDQLTTASEVDSLLGGNIPAAEAAPPSAPVRIPGMAPAGVNVTVADAQPMQAPEVAQTAQTPTQFLPGNPAQIRQQLADAGLGIRGRVRVVNGVEGVEFGEGWADVLGVVGGNGARTDVPSADGAGRGEVSPTVAGSSLRDDLQAQPFDLGGSNDRLGLARQPATVSSASPAETPQPTQTEATVDGTLAGSGITGIGSNVPGNEPTGIDGTGGVVGNAQGAPALRSTAVFPTTGTTTVAESSAATSNQQGATPAPPALQDLTDDERNIWPALKSEVLDSVQNPGGRAILDPQTGAVVGRTKPAELGPVSGFWRQIPNSKWSSKTVIAALDAASTGAPLTTQQKNIVQYAKGWVREYAAEHKAQLAVAESDSRLAQREEVRGDIEATLPSVTDTSPQQRASVVSLGHDYTAKLLELKRARAAGRLNPDQSEAYIDLLEQDRETGKVAGRPMVGIGNKTAYVDALMQGKLMPVQAFLDADNFKALNDKFGHDVGDDVIRLIADVVREEFGDGNVFHRGGDEFLTQGMTQEEVDAKMARVQDYLARVNMELPLSDGRTATLTGVGVSYGTGANEKAADDSLKQDKQRRKDAGLRFDRREGDDSGSVGAQPVSAGIDASGTNSRDSTGTGAEGVGDAARVQNVADTGNEGTDGASGAAVGGPVSSGTARQDTATVPADVVGRDAGKRGDGVRETGTVQRDVLDASGALSELSSTLGPKFTQRLTAQPWFHLVETLGEIPDGVRKTLTDAETAAGFVHTNGHVYIIAGNIDAGNVTGVVLHEVGVHFGMSGILGDDFPVVLRNFKRMRAKGGAVARAYERVPKSTPADLIDEEALAYYVEENWNTDAPLIQRVVDAIKALLNRLGVPLSKLNASPSLLVNVAKGAASKAARGLVSVRNGKIVYHKAWHGSPHDFDKFRLDDSTIGTGEGAQAFGHGLYFAGARQLAEHYAGKLSQPSYVSGAAFAHGQRALAAAAKAGKSGRDASRFAMDMLHEEMLAESGNARRDIQAAINNIDSIASSKGKLYEVELAPNESDYLDWDAPLSEQSEKVREALGKFVDEMGDVYPMVRDSMQDFERGSTTGASLYRALSRDVGSNARASADLKLIGIPGIRYLDGSSRGKGEGSRNFVIFDDSQVEVKAKYSRTPASITVDGTERPTTDSTGKAIHPTEEGLRNFWRWFGESENTDADGQPVVFYNRGDKEIAEIGGGGRFGGLFVLPHKGASHYGKVETALYLRGKTASSSDLAEYLDAMDDGGQETLSKLAGRVFDEDEANAVRDAIINETFVEGDAFSEAIGAIDFADGYGDMQKLRGAVAKDAGFQSVQIDDEFSRDTLLIVDSGAAKSATGNTGAFSPTDRRIAYSRRVPRTADQESALAKAGMPEDHRTLIQRGKDYVSAQWGNVKALATMNTAQSVFDRFHRMSSIEQELGIPAERSAYLSARLSAGLPSIMEGLMMYGAPKWEGGVLAPDARTVGLLEALKPVADDINGWLGWMVGRRAKVLKSQGRENLMTDTDIAALMSLAKGREQQFEDAALQYLRIKKAVLDVAEQAGLIDPAARATWDSVEYIPFYRQDETDGDTIGPGTRQGIAGQSSGIRSLKGGKQNLSDPLGNIVRNFTRLIDASLKNNAMLEAVNGYGPSFFEKVPMDGTFERIALSQVKKVLLERGVPQALIDQMPQGTLTGLTKMWAIKPPADDDVVRVMRGGKAEYYRVPDKDLLASLTAFKVPAMHWALSPFKFFKKLLTVGVTSTPDFMARNFVRDSLSSWVISDDKFAVGWDSVKGVISPLLDKTSQKEMMFAGGSFIGGQFYEVGSEEATAKALRRALRAKGLSSADIETFVGTVASSPLALWDKWQKVGSYLENANRNAIYENAIKAGRSKKEAAYMARDLMDFSMHGNSQFIQFLSDVLPFFNARLQGLYKLYRQGGKKALRKALLMRAGTIAAGTLALLAWNMLMFGDGYDELEEWDKDTYWHIMPGTPWHIRVPKPFELGVLFATVPERVARAVTYQVPGGDTGDRPDQTLKSFLAQVSGTLAMNPIPQAAIPIMELWANKSFFTGRPIENMGDLNLMPEAREEWYTSDSAKAISDVIGNSTGLSPKRIEHLWNGYTGTLGGYALDTVDWLVRSVEKAPDRPELAWAEMPLLKAFYRGDMVPKNTRYVTEFYELSTLADQVSNTIKEYEVAGQKDRAKAEEADYAWLLGKRVPSKQAKAGFMHENVQMLNKQAAELAKIRKQVNGIVGMPGFTDIQKRQKIETLTAQRNMIAKKVTRALRSRGTSSR